MALAKERSIQAHESFIMNSVDHLSPQSQYSSPDEFEQDKSPRYGGGGGGPPMRAANSHHHHSEDGHDSVINFTTFMASSDQPLLSFDPKEELYNMDHHHHHQSNYPRFNGGCHYSCFQTAASDDNSYGWLYSDSTVTTDTSFEDSRATKESSSLNNKRPMMGESNPAVKKQCSSSSTSATNSKKPKVQKPSTASKDPQSIAAKNRRERISERLKVLQELVPNGSKVDLVTMLEKAISYVKFLQLQVKVLATDDFWPVQGGKAPDISQVREAIDAILSSSKREKNSRPN